MISMRINAGIFESKEDITFMNKSENGIGLELIKEILSFRDERNWKQYHNPKDLAISLSIEAAELLEIFQWSSWEEAMQKRERISEELADVLMYCILLADSATIDVSEAIRSKLQKNCEKYPVDKAFGRKEKYSEF